MSHPRTSATKNPEMLILNLRRPLAKIAEVLLMCEHISIGFYWSNLAILILVKILFSLLVLALVQLRRVTVMNGDENLIL